MLLWFLLPGCTPPIQIQSTCDLDVQNGKFDGLWKNNLSYSFESYFSAFFIIYVDIIVENINIGTILIISLVQTLFITFYAAVLWKLRLILYTKVCSSIFSFINELNFLNFPPIKIYLIKFSTKSSRKISHFFLS